MKILMAAVAAFGLLFAADAANKACPVSGKPVDQAQTVDFKVGEKTVKLGFCCGGCKGKYEKDPASFKEAATKAVEGK